MSRLIDADALKKEYCGECRKEIQELCKDDPICGSMMWIDEAPTVDAVEVVRCKDCVYSVKYPAGYYCYDPSDEYSDSVWVREDDFCSYGERKTND